MAKIGFFASIGRVLSGGRDVAVSGTSTVVTVFTGTETSVSHGAEIANITTNKMLAEAKLEAKSDLAKLEAVATAKATATAKVVSSKKFQNSLAEKLEAELLEELLGA